MIVIAKIFETYVYLVHCSLKEVGFCLENNHVLEENEFFSPRTWLLLKET